MDKTKITIFDDSTPDSYFDETPNGASKGYKGIFKSQQTADELTVPFPQELLIPESDYQGWIEEMEERKSTPLDLMNQVGMRCKNQKQTSLCWAFSPVFLLQLWRIIQGQSFVSLSPASVSGPINNFKNQGGWGEDALRRLIEAGADPSSVWPDTAIDKRLYTQQNQNLAMNYRATEWFNLRPRNLHEHISCLLRRMPTSSGRNYWQHQTTDLQPVWRNGKIGIMGINQWGEDWPTPGANGIFILQGNKMPADDLVSIRSGTASA